MLYRFAIRLKYIKKRILVRMGTTKIAVIYRDYD